MAQLSDLAKLLEQIREKMGGEGKNFDEAMKKMNGLRPQNVEKELKSSNFGAAAKTAISDIPGISPLVAELSKLNRLFTALFPGGGAAFSNLFRGLTTNLPQSLNKFTQAVARPIVAGAVQGGTSRLVEDIRTGAGFAGFNRIIEKLGKGLFDVKYPVGQKGLKFEDLMKQLWPEKNGKELDAITKQLSDALLHMKGSLGTSTEYYTKKVIENVGKMGGAVGDFSKGLVYGLRHPLNALDVFANKLGSFKFMQNAKENVIKWVGNKLQKGGEGLHQWANWGRGEGSVLEGPADIAGGIMKGIGNKILGASKYIKNAKLSKNVMNKTAKIGLNIANTADDVTGNVANSMASQSIMVGAGMEVAAAGGAGGGAGAVSTVATAGGAGAVATAGMVVGSVIAALVAVPIIVVGFGASVLAITKTLIESQRKLAEVSGPMAAAFAMHDVRTMLRDMRSGNARAEATDNLMREYDKFMEDIRPLLDKLYIVSAELLTKLIAWMDWMLKSIPGLVLPAASKETQETMKHIAEMHEETKYGINMPKGMSLSFVKNPDGSFSVDPNQGATEKAWAAAELFQKEQQGHPMGGVSNKANQVLDKANKVLQEHSDAIIDWRQQWTKDDIAKSGMSPEILIHELANGHYNKIKDRAMERVVPQWKR